MSRRVQLSLRAEQDLDQILNWLQQRSPQGATAWLKRWNETLSSCPATFNQPNAPSCRRLRFTFPILWTLGYNVRKDIVNRIV